MLVVRVLMALLISGFGFYFGVNIPLSDQWTFFEALRTTTSIVFGVMGALLAIVYPEVLKQGFRATSTTVPQVDLNRIVSPLVQSALLLVLLIILAPLFAWVKASDVPPGTLLDGHVQQVTFSLFCLMSYWQILILLFVIRPLDVLQSNTDDALLRTRARESIHTNGGS